MKKTSFPVLSEQIEFRELSNGLRICVLPRRRVRTVMMQAWVATGSIHEGKHLGSGLSHFLEHMLFHGTASFPGSRISDRVAELGGSLNAATSPETTHAYFNLPPEHLREGLTMLDSLIREPLLPAENFDTERDVILREDAMYKDSPLYHFLDKLQLNTIRNHPVRWPVIGFPDLLMAITPEIMREYHTRRYTPGRTVYVVTGDVEPEQVFDILADRTSAWKRGCLEEPVLPDEPQNRFRRRRQVEFSDPNAYYGASWRTPGSRSPDHLALSAFADILGNGDSSRLYEELVNRRQLARDLIFFSLNLCGIGYSSIIAIADPAKVRELSARTFDILTRFIEQGPTEEELERLRNDERVQFLHNLNDNAELARIIADSMLKYGSADAIDAFLPAVAALTPDDLIRAGRKYLSADIAVETEQLPPGRTSARKKQTETARSAEPQFRTLPSGHRLLVMEDHELPLAALSIRLPGGPINETPQQRGTSRLLVETLGCATADHSEEEFNRLLERNAIGLHITEQSSSVLIGADCPVEKLSVAVDLIGSMLRGPLFSREIVDRERGNLIAELKSALMNPSTVAGELSNQAMFGSHPLGIGRAELIRSLQQVSPDGLLEYFRSVCLSAPETVIGLHGDLTFDEAEKAARKLIRACRWNSRKGKTGPEPVYPEKDIRRTASLPRRQAVVSVMLRGSKYQDDDQRALQLVLSSCDSLSSRLNRKVREQQGLVYHARFVSTPCVGFDGSMGFRGATSAEGAPVLEKIFRDEIRHLARYGLSREEFETARRIQLFQLEDCRQDPAALLRSMLISAALGNGWEYVWHLAERLKKMTWQDTNRRLKRLFSGRPVVTAVVLPENEQEKKK